MRVFAIADLHMDGKQGKPMDVFGDNWIGHTERIETAWIENVADDDLVLIPGDISWAMQLDDAVCDIERIAALPGTKLLLRGNHDYWWSSVTKMRSCFPPSVKLIQNDSFVFENIVVAGTRGWLYPGATGYVQKNDEKIYNREQLRLNLTLADAMRHIERGEAQSILLMMHFPPLGENGENTGYTDIIAQYPLVTDIVYGHLHAQATYHAFEGKLGDKNYWLCSADHLNFIPKFIMQL